MVEGSTRLAARRVATPPAPLAARILPTIVSMTLGKIVSIKNVGRFLNSAAVGDVTFNRYNLIFAENGRGKTTLCAILRSLQSGEPAYIIGRHTLGSPGPPEVQFLLDGNRLAIFSNGAWNETLPQLAVFDSTFITENVHAGETVDTAQRRNLYRVIIGSQGVGLARRIDDLDAQIRAKNTEIRDAAAAVQRHIPQGMTIETFVGLPEDPDIDTNIAAKERELEAVKQADAIRQRALISKITLPELPASFADLLGKTLEGVAAEAERLVAEHIARHEMAERGEPWLSEGLGYIRDENCPFCARSLAGVPLIDAYKAFFSDAYHALRDEIGALARDIEADFGDREIAAIERTADQNEAGGEFWQQYSTFDPPQLGEPGDVAESLAALRKAALALLERKAAAPLEPLQPDEAFREARAASEQARDTVSAYNAAVDTANAIVAAKKLETEAANVQAAEEALARLKAQNTRHTQAVREACETYQAHLTEKADFERQKTETREELDEHTGQVIAQYGQSINRYLDRFNVGFRITTPTHAYHGGTPISSYKILINETPVDLGDASTPLDRPSFKNTLSAGDRSALALAFFLSQLEQDPDRADKVVVLDDPFTSQDNFRRNHTAFQIKSCGEACAQTVLLSHDPNFLKLVWDKLAPADRKTLQLARIGEENTAVAEWDIEKAVQARYRGDVEVLQKYHTLGEGEPRDVIQKIRPVLEGYCRNLYSTQFTDQDSLGTMVGKIRAAGAAHPLHAIVDHLEELNDYCRRYHHGENPNAATELIDDNELKGYVKRTLTLAGCF